MRGEMTAFFALMFVVMIGLAGSLMESASIQSAKNYRRADMNRAIESVFAEYQKELLKKYDIFALEGSYESGTYEEEKLLKRLDFYGAGGMEQEISRIELLTDQSGQPFLSQVSDWFKYRYGLGQMESLLAQAGKWKSGEADAEELLHREEQQNRELSSLLEEQQASLPETDNALQAVSQLKKSPLVLLAMPKDKTVSQKTIVQEQQPSRRSIHRGYGVFTDVAEEGAASGLALGVYQMEHFSSAVPEEEKTDATGALDYELEYIIGGKSSDGENLEAVLQKLLVIRMVSNFAYLQSDAQKKAEAAAAAAVLCALLTVPPLVEAVTQALLFAWAFGESVVDLRALLGEKKVPVLKDASSWQLTLSGLLTLGKDTDREEGKDAEGGLGYEEYLQILLFLVNQEQSAMRSLDLIEQHMQTEMAFSWFRVDQCITKLYVKTRCNLRRGISYTFSTYYGYR